MLLLKQIHPGRNNFLTIFNPLRDKKTIFDKVVFLFSPGSLMNKDKGPIGVFDSGYGGLTILREIVRQLPEYNYLYLGDNARSPYGGHSYQSIYQYTLECVKWFFRQGCPLVILACNTASAKALRTIQQVDLPTLAPGNRVLGVIRPTTEIIGNFTKTNSIGVLGTTGTVESGSYKIEINKFFPSIKVYQQACPMWVPLVENNEYMSPGADYFIQKGINELLSQSGEIDTILLACTHYPLLIKKIQQFIPKGVQLVSQGEIVANSLKKYLKKHPEFEFRCLKGNSIQFFTTDSASDFDFHSASFFGNTIHSRQITL